jgi:hypothetical protein
MPKIIDSLSAHWRPVAMSLVAVSLFSGALSLAAAQTQEPKPAVPTPSPVEQQQQQQQASGDGSTGVAGARWEGPNWGVRLAWDPSEWAVEAESIQPGYDGLQIGTPRTTVFIEAYEGFGGDAEACLADAEQEISAREGVTEVVSLPDRPLPVPDDVRGPAQLFGVTASLADGTPYRGIEYVECRTVAPGVAVLEITWQGVVGAFNEDFPRVETLLATLEIPDAGAPMATPVAPTATPGVPQATPIA